MSGKPIDEAVMERVARAIAEVNGEDPAGWRYYQADAIVAIDILTAAQQQGQAVAWVSPFGSCVCQGEDACPGCNPNEAIAMAREIAAQEERLKHAPCIECGAASPQDAQGKCLCSGDRDDCHGCQLWPDDTTAPPPSVPMQQGGGEVRIPSAAEWCDENAAEATMEWRAGWDACRAEYPRTAPPSAPVGVETVDAAAWIEVLELPEGFRVAEHLPGIWEYQFDIEDEADEDSDRKVSGTSWNHPALAAIAAWSHAYDALAQQPAADNVPQDAGRVAVHFLARIFAAQEIGTDGEYRGWKISGKGSLNEVVAEARAWLAGQQPAAVDEANRSRRMQKLWLDEWLSDYDVEMTSDAYAELLDALATQHQGPKS